ncbi:hypothetical protein D3C80_1157980 [compost metagenome]
MLFSIISSLLQCIQLIDLYAFGREGMRTKIAECRRANISRWITWCHTRIGRLLHQAIPVVVHGFIYTEHFYTNTISGEYIDIIWTQC